MKIKRIKKLKVNDKTFTIIWDKTTNGGYFRYNDYVIGVGVRTNKPSDILMILCHELQEICACEMHVRFYRTDCDGEYLFSYDHRQHTTMMYLFSGLLSQFIE